MISNSNQNNNTHKRSNNEHSPSALLSKEENDAIIRLLGNKSQCLATAVVQVYCSDPPSHTKWTKRLCGVACFVKDHGKRSYFIRIFDLDQQQQVWEQELYNHFKYKTPRSYFHTFEAETCQTGLNFADEGEASQFQKVIQGRLRMKMERSERKRMMTNSMHQPTQTGVLPGMPTAPIKMQTMDNDKKNKKSSTNNNNKKKAKFTKADSSEPTNFQHVSHVCWDPNKGLDLFQLESLDPKLKEFFKVAGVSESQLQDSDTRKFIYDFIDKNGLSDVLRSADDEEMDAQAATARLPVPNRFPPPAPVPSTPAMGSAGSTAPPPSPVRVVAPTTAPLAPAVQEQRSSPSMTRRPSPPPPPLSRGLPQPPSTPPSAKMPQKALPSPPLNAPPLSSGGPPPPPPPPPPAPEMFLPPPPMPSEDFQSSVPPSSEGDVHSALLQSIHVGTSLKQQQQVWEQELYNHFKYKTPRSYFHTFEAETCQTGLNFADEGEASQFQKVIQGRLRIKMERSERKRMMTKSMHQPTQTGVLPGMPTAPIKMQTMDNDKKNKKSSKNSNNKKKAKFTKADSSEATNFQHVSHVGWDPNKGLDLFQLESLDPNLKEFFQMAGVSESQLQDSDTRKFIYDFIDKNGLSDVMRSADDEEMDAQAATARLPVPNRFPPPAPVPSTPAMGSAGRTAPVPSPVRVVSPTTAPLAPAVQEQRSSPSMTRRPSPPPPPRPRGLPQPPSTPPSAKMPQKALPPPPHTAPPLSSGGPPPPPPPPPPAPEMFLPPPPMPSEGFQSSVPPSGEGDVHSALLQSIRVGTSLKQQQQIWEQELYNHFKYKTPRSYFHTFEAETCQTGLNFADEGEASQFQKVIQGRLRMKMERSERKRMMTNSMHQPTQTGVLPGMPTAPIKMQTMDNDNKKSSKNSNNKKIAKFTKADSSEPTNFQHVSHVGWDPNKGLDLFQLESLDPKLKELFQMAGVSESQLQDSDTRKFIYDFIDKNGLSAVLRSADDEEMDAQAATARPPVPNRFPPPAPVPSTPAMGSAGRTAPPPSPVRVVAPTTAPLAPAVQEQRSSPSMTRRPSPPPPPRSRGLPQPPSTPPSAKMPQKALPLPPLTAPPPPYPPPPPAPEMFLPPPPMPSEGFQSSVPPSGGGDVHSALLQSIRVGTSLKIR